MEKILFRMRDLTLNQLGDHGSGVTLQGGKKHLDLLRIMPIACPGFEIVRLDPVEPDLITGPVHGRQMPGGKIVSRPRPQLVTLIRKVPQEELWHKVMVWHGGRSSAADRTYQRTPVANRLSRAELTLTG